MSKEIQKILLFFLISYSIYCAIIIGETWDEAFHLNQGKIVLDYLLSFGEIDHHILYRENYSAIYWSLSYLLTKQFPLQYQIEVSHLLNLIFSLSAIIGIGKLTQELFNKKVGKIVFLILFFYPVFFGHMAINSKDTIVAFSHVWITYLMLRYLKNQSLKNKTSKYIIFLAILAALATGIQLVFLGSLIPIILFFLFDVFFVKKIIKKNFSTKKLIYDLVKCFIIFYLFLIFFWIDAHPNILTLPINILLGTFSENFRGWPFNLINGNYYLSAEIPKLYLLINLFFRSPEFILFTYLIFLFLFFSSKEFFVKRINFFNYKILILLFILIFPNIVLFLVPYPVYDGMRLFLWTLPYICIIPGLTIYYLIENFKKITSKIISFLLLPLIFYFLFIFISLTPYHYTYLNFFNGLKENRYQKFENDYWGSSLHQLIKNINFEKNKNLKFAVCGVNEKILESYLRKRGYNNFDIVNNGILNHVDNASYIVMTNRVAVEFETNEELKLTNCFDKFPGIDLFVVKKNGIPLSILRKIN